MRKDALGILSDEVDDCMAMAGGNITEAAKLMGCTPQQMTDLVTHRINQEGR